MKRSDDALSLWFPKLWFQGVIFVLLRHSSTFVKEITKRSRRDALLKFAQNIATNTCPILLDFWHVLTRSKIDGSLAAIRGRTASFEQSSSSDDDKNEHQLEQQLRSKMFDLDGSTRKLDIPVKQFLYPDLLARLVNSCRIVRRETEPPEFVLRTIQKLIAAPCQICGVGIVLKKSSSSSSRHHYSDPVVGKQNTFSKKKSTNNSIKKKKCFGGGTFYQLNPFTQYDEGRITSNNNNNDDSDDHNDDSIRDDESLAGGKVATVASINSHIDKNFRGSHHDRDGEEDDEMYYDDDIDNKNRPDENFFLKPRQRELLHIANLVLPYQFSSVKTVRVIVELLDEATVRCTKESSQYFDHWNNLVRVCIECLSRPELRGVPRKMEAQLFHQQFNDIKNEKTAKYKNKLRRKLIIDEHADISAAEKENQKMLQRELAISEKELRTCFLTPLDRVTSRDLFTLAHVFQRGKGWIRHDQTVTSLRDIFDEERIRYLFQERNEVWARCLLGENMSTSYEGIETIVEDIMHDDSNSDNDDDLTKQEEEEADKKNKIVKTKKVSGTMSVGFLMWVTQRRMMKRVLQQQQQGTKNQRNSSSNLLISNSCCRDISYNIMRFIFKIESYPRDFDSFTRMILSLDK